MVAWKNTKRKRIIQRHDLNRIPKNTFVSLPCLQFGVYDDVSNFSIGMKASVLTYEKLGFASGIYTTKGCKKFNAKRVSLADSRPTPNVNLDDNSFQQKSSLKMRKCIWKKVNYMRLEYFKFIFGLQLFLFSKNLFYLYIRCNY